MSAVLLLPAALGALAALLIPLAIHVARRSESRTVAFAALQWLQAQARPRRRPTLDERGLLAVRLLLLALLALALAQPVLRGVEDRRPVVAVAPGVDRAAGAASDESRRVWLAPGFPALEGEPPAGGDPVSLIRQLDAELPPGAPLTVVVPPVLEGADAERPRLSRRVDWRIAPLVRPSAAPDVEPAPALTVRYAPASEAGVRYFRAAAVAWTAPGLRPDFEAAAVDQPVDRSARHLVWLAPGPLPETVVRWVRDGGTAVLAHDARAPSEGEAVPVWRDDVGEPLAVVARLGRGRVVRFTRPLQPAAIPALVEPDFPDALARMLAPPLQPARVMAADHAPLAGGSAYPRPPLDLGPWLALLIALMFGLERWMATRRRRAVVA